MRKPTIRTTTDYTLFVSHENNRQLRIRKHKKLGESIKKYGVLPYWPVVVRRTSHGKLWVLDGQHRVWFAMDRGLPVYYVIADEDFSIAEINNTQKPWVLLDYVEMYTAQGKQDYREAVDFSVRHKLCLSRAMAMLAGTTSLGNIKDAIEAGDYRITDRDFAERVAATYCPIIGMDKSLKKDSFLDACMACCRVTDFDPHRFVDGASKCRNRLVNYGDRDAFLQMMEDIYNFKKRSLFALRIKAIEAMRSRNVLAKKTAAAI